jgi:LPS-assembly protein
MNYKAQFLVYISALACQLVLPGCLLLAQVQTPAPAGTLPPEGETSSASVVIRADSQEKEGDVYQLVGQAEVLYGSLRLTADRIEYNEATGQMVATGAVHFFHLTEEADLQAARAEYDLRAGTGSFFEVEGSVGAQIRGGSSVLTTTNPFFFTAEQVDREGENTYRVLNGQMTVCLVPDPTWLFSAARATIQPGISARLYSGQLRFWKIPVFYFPFLYKSLRRIPRSSGFLMPSIGNSSRLGFVIGDSFFWAINRSTDLEIGAEYLSERGWSQQAMFRVRPSNNSFLNVSYFGVVDRGVGPQKVDQGGRFVRATGVASLPHGFAGVLDLNYLSSLTFREAFTQTYAEAVNSEVHTTGFLTKSIDSFSVNALVSRSENFQSVRPGDRVKIRHLPQVEFNSVDRPLWRTAPLWVSWQSFLGGVSRSDPFREDVPFLRTATLERMAFAPRITVPLQWNGFHLTPVVGVRAIHYGKRQRDGEMRDESLDQGTGELSVELAPPSLARVFPSLGPLYAQPVRHVIEPKVTFRAVSGVRDFDDILVFDERDRLTNTREMEYSLTNRLLVRRGGPGANQGSKEVLSWEVRQQYYFDTDFGGALVAGRRNVFLSPLDLTSNAFLDGPRRFSPIASIVRFHPSPGYDIEFRQDYDTEQRRLTHGGLVGNARWGQAFASVSHFFVRSSPVLSPNFNQIGFTAGYGSTARVGFNVVGTGAFDIRAGFLQYSAFQVSYNNDCCGISFEYRRFALGPVRNENQFRLAFSLANIGTFGNLKKQERLF